MSDLIGFKLNVYWLSIELLYKRLKYDTTGVSFELLYIYYLFDNWGILQCL